MKEKILTAIGVAAALFVIIPVGGMGTICGILWFFGMPVHGITPYLRFVALCAVLMWSFFGHLAYQNQEATLRNTRAHAQMRGVRQRGRLRLLSVKFLLPRQNVFDRRSRTIFPARWIPRRRIDTTRIIQAMIYRFLFLLVIAVTAVGCSNTEFQSWEGRNSVVEGRGGTRKVVDGMDVWTYGDPLCCFQVIGIIQDNRPGGVIPMAQMKHDIVAKARQSGGDAVIIVSSQSQLAGYYTSGERHRIWLWQLRISIR